MNNRKKYHPEEDKDFCNAVSDIILSPDVQKLRMIAQHSTGNRYHHSLYVSHLSYKICKKLGWDAETAARGAMLHDFELTDEIKERPKSYKMFFMHPKIALEHASLKFELSKKEKDIIVKHMWPATPHLVPKYKESMVVCLVDTYCAIVEFLNVSKKAKNTYVVGLNEE